MNRKLPNAARRLNQLKGFAVVIMLNLSAFTQIAVAQKLKLTDLQVEHQNNPMSVDAIAPRMSWKINSTLKNTVQTSYEIRVGSDQAALSSARKATWESGKK